MKSYVVYMYKLADIQLHVYSRSRRGEAEEEAISLSTLDTWHRSVMQFEITVKLNSVVCDTVEVLHGSIGLHNTYACMYNVCMSCRDLAY